MILVAHALIGTALTNRFSNKFAAFSFAFLSHYAADMIPHWHYSTPYIAYALRDSSPTRTVFFSQQFFFDMFTVSIDLALGIILALFIFRGASQVIIVIGALSACLPDMLSGLSKIYPMAILTWQHNIHLAMHTDILLDNAPLIGILSQIAAVVIVLLLSKHYTVSVT